MQIRWFVVGLLFGLVLHPTEAAAGPRSYTPIASFALAEGQAFPLEALRDPQSRPLELSTRSGKPLLINFYTLRCAPCIKEVPKLNQVKRRQPGIRVLAITADSGDEAKAYVKQHGLQWPVAADAGRLLYEELNQKAFPAFALLDAQGRLVSTVQANQLGGEDGHATVQGIEQWLNAQIKKTQP